MTESNIKVNSRVKRKAGRGGFGIVKDVHSETVSARSHVAGESELMVGVLWDTGTLSYLSPTALELAPEKGK